MLSTLQFYKQVQIYSKIITNQSLELAMQNIEKELPSLDKVLQSRGSKKQKLQANEPALSAFTKTKQISSKTKQISKQSLTKQVAQKKLQERPVIKQLNSIQLGKYLTSNLPCPQQLRQIFLRLKDIKSLKYDKFTQRIEENLIGVGFDETIHIFQNIMQKGYDLKICSNSLLYSIFQGFQNALLKIKVYDIEIYRNLLEYYLKLPNVLNKKFAFFIVKSCQNVQKKDLFTTLKFDVENFIDKKITQSLQNTNLREQNQKILGLIVAFNLETTFKIQKLMQILPINKINQYIQAKQSTSTQKMHNSKQKRHQKSNQKQVSVFVDQSIRTLISKDNLKQVQKIIRLHKIPLQNYPEFVDKLQFKYLQYIERSNKIYVIDQIIKNKIHLVKKIIDIYVKKRKFQDADHFIHKYGLINTAVDPKKVYKNPLHVQDQFGPTQSHVLHLENQKIYMHLNEFQISKNDILWVDAQSILMKKQKNALIQLLMAQQIGLDSQSSPAIHVFDKANLQLIQIYNPIDNKVFLFDVQNFKTSKKQRNRKSSSKIIAQQTEKKGKSKQQPIQLQQDEQWIKQSKIRQEQPEQGKAWSRFTRIIKRLFENSTIYGHVLHGDLSQIIQALSLPLKSQNMKIKDSQTQFKKTYPTQTKSNLCYLSEKCFSKGISKFQQCGAWDCRPLRKAQRHYAALDAVLPYKLVKFMEDKVKKEQQLYE